jgi:hypothetical protein
MRPYLEKPITKKGWWSGSSGKNACLASIDAVSSNPKYQNRKEIPGQKGLDLI